MHIRTYITHLPRVFPQRSPRRPSWSRHAVPGHAPKDVSLQVGSSVNMVYLWFLNGFVIYLYCSKIVYIYIYTYSLYTCIYIYTYRLYTYIYIQMVCSILYKSIMMKTG